MKNAADKNTQTNLQADERDIMKRLRERTKAVLAGKVVGHYIFF